MTNKHSIGDELIPVSEAVLSPNDELFGFKDIYELVDKSDIPEHLQGYITQLLVLAETYKLMRCHDILKAYLHARMANQARGWEGLMGVMNNRVKDSEELGSKI